MLSNCYYNTDKHKMKRHYNDPGLQVGDKIRFVFQWEDEDGKIKTGDPSKVLTVIEVSIRSFVVEYVIEGTDKITSIYKWAVDAFWKEGNCWYAKIFMDFPPEESELLRLTL